MLKASDIGEYAFVKRILNRICRSPSNKSSLKIVVPPGDDAFAVSLNMNGNKCIVGTTDILIEDVHFKTSWERKFKSLAGFYRALGNKSLAVNLSDLAAMGPVKPLFCLIGLGIPVDTTVDTVDNFYNGFLSLASKYRIFLGGGDTNSSKKWIISVTAIGIIEPGKIIRRYGAMPDDFIYSTGFFGDSAAGLKILNAGKGKIKNNSDTGYLVKRHLLPPVNLIQSKELSKFASSMIDSSDGLYNSVMQICRASGAGAKIYADRIPVTGALKRFTGNWLDLALYGGEDYELVFTSRMRIKNPSAKLIGIITEKKQGIKIFENETSKKIIPVKKSGFEHFHNQ